MWLGSGGLLPFYLSLLCIITKSQIKNVKKSSNKQLKCQTEVVHISARSTPHIQHTVHLKYNYIPMSSEYQHQTHNSKQQMSTML